MAAAQDLIRAIEGYKGGKGGEATHEELLAHLARVHGEAVAGRKGAGDDSPGRREAGLAAYQREIPSERGRSGGDGQVKSNEPGDFGGKADGPGVIAPDKGDEQGKLTRTAGVPTSGNRHSVLPSGGYPHGAAPFRTVAAAKGVVKIHEPARMSGGNRVSVNPAPAAASESRVGGAVGPSKTRTDGNSGDWEKVPGYAAKEDLGPDVWQRAQEGVRKLLKAPKR